MFGVGQTFVPAIFASARFLLPIIFFLSYHLNRNVLYNFVCKSWQVYTARSCFASIQSLWRFKHLDVSYDFWVVFLSSCVVLYPISCVWYAGWKVFACFDGDHVSRRPRKFQLFVTAILLDCNAFSKWNHASCQLLVRYSSVIVTMFRFRFT